MSAVNNGAELVKRLKEHKTPDQRLAPARAALAKVKKERGQVANAAEVIAALERVYGDSHMTVVKAKAIAKDGKWAPPVQERAVVAIEDALLESADAELSTATPDAPEPAKRGRSRKAVSTKQIQDAEPVGA